MGWHPAYQFLQLMQPQRFERRYWETSNLQDLDVDINAQHTQHFACANRTLAFAIQTLLQVECLLVNRIAEPGPCCPFIKISGGIVLSALQRFLSLMLLIHLTPHYPSSQFFFASGMVTLSPPLL